MIEPAATRMSATTSGLYGLIAAAPCCIGVDQGSVPSTTCRLVGASPADGKVPFVVPAAGVREPPRADAGPATDAVFPAPAEPPSMRIRGRRECVACGMRWSYFETGDVECPACGSVRSVATADEGVRHTAVGAGLDLTAARAAVDDRPVSEVADLAARATRSFLADRGFIDAGELQPLDETTVAAAELEAAADRLKRAMAPDEAAEGYLLELLRGAPDGDRPDEVPEALRSARGLGAATAVARYRSDLARHLDDHPDPEARRLLGILRDHLRRVQALDGDVPVETADRLVAAARDLGDHCRGEEGALERAADRLARL